MNEKCVIYARVSTNGQVITGTGLDRQVQVCQEFAEKSGFLPVQAFCEEGVSGTIAALARPAFSQMLATMGSTDIKIIVVERADRLARDLIESELVIRECQELGIKIFCADSGEDIVFSADEDPTRKLIRQIMGALAEWDKNVIVKKLKAGRDRKKRDTGRCEGRKPYDNPLVIARIMNWYYANRTPSSIAGYLNREKELSPTGGEWSPRTVKRIVQRELRKKNII